MGLSADDAGHMAQALRLAERGLYTTDPNPRVGCVLTRDGAVVGEGFHERAGAAHAEVHALAAAGPRARGSTAYLTLEPCSHHGRTPPCADALVAAGVARVVAAMEDPNPRVRGQGLARLRTAGIAVETGLMAAEAAALNPGFVQRMAGARPFVRMKIAASLDGRTALASGASQWITGEAARADVQHWRARSSAIVTGIGTVRADDPSLTVRRFDTGRPPLRVVLDGTLAMSPGARMLSLPGATLVVCRVAAAAARAALQAAGAEVLEQPGAGPVDLSELLRELARREANEVLVEAGAGLSGAFIAAGLVDEMVLFLAPHFLGHEARALAQLPGLSHMGQRGEWDLADVRQVGADLRLILRPRPR